LIDALNPVEHGVPCSCGQPRAVLGNREKLKHRIWTDTFCWQITPWTAQNKFNKYQVKKR
jgi:hypothetical protein